MRKPEIFRRKYLRNKKLDNYSCKEYISGQKFGSASKMKYGLCHMSFNGCECIAVFNAMVYLGKDRKLWEVTKILERYRMLMGIFGCNPAKLGKALNLLNTEYENLSDADKEGAYIISYWTGRRFLSSLHTVFAVNSGSSLTVYNRYGNSCKVYRYGSLRQLLEGRKLIKLYYIGKINTIYNK